MSDLGSIRAASIVSPAATPPKATALTEAPAREIAAADPSFLNPKLTIDASTGKAILEFRNNDSGDVIQTLPNEYQLRAYRLFGDASAKETHAEKVAPQPAAVASSGAAPSAPATATSATPVAEPQPTIATRQTA